MSEGVFELQLGSGGSCAIENRVNCVNCVDGFPAFNTETVSSSPSHHSDFNFCILNRYLRDYLLSEKGCEIPSGSGRSCTVANRDYRVIVSPAFMAESEFSSPTEFYCGSRSDMLGRRCQSFIELIREGLPLDRLRPYRLTSHYSPTKGLLPNIDRSFGSRFSVLASPSNPSPSPSRFARRVKYFHPPCVSLPDIEGWQVVSRKREKAPLL